MKNSNPIATFEVLDMPGFGPGLHQEFTMDLSKGGTWEGPSGQLAIFGTDETEDRPRRTLQAWFPGASVLVKPEKVMKGLSAAQYVERMEALENE